MKALRNAPREDPINLHWNYIIISLFCNIGTLLVGFSLLKSLISTIRSAKTHKQKRRVKLQKLSAYFVAALIVVTFAQMIVPIDV